MGDGDRSGEGFRRSAQAPASFTVTPKAAGTAQPLEDAHDLASIAAAGRRHQFDEELRSVLQRCLDAVEAAAIKGGRRGDPEVEPLALSEGHRAVEAGLATDAGVVLQ